MKLPDQCWNKFEFELQFSYIRSCKLLAKINYQKIIKLDQPILRPNPWKCMHFFILYRKYLYTRGVIKIQHDHKAKSRKIRVWVPIYIRGCKLPLNFDYQNIIKLDQPIPRPNPWKCMLFFILYLEYLYTRVVW
jgi:hypothetical protein